ncbi:TOPRIM nucleotidyl transferase/hydrolase domain-containing protein [Pseudomonas sp. MBLB4136]|uniref:TOPRIM nucleotidyl transferase/hydrolase domain-containing protein n=1 Tax=Pseudomonas sp. MBLB4136 TaxID=3451558 RepID=UPI003F7570B0
MVIVEGDGEAILLPALAKIMGRDFTRHGVSVVNVGGTGLGRYSRILQRAKPEDGMLHIPVARIADMDVMPDCAPAILGLVDDDNDPRWFGKHRRWKAMRHFGDNKKTRDEALAARRAMLKSDDAQNVQTFVATHWTLEYDLAYAGLAKQLLVAARLAANDDALNLERKQANEVVQAAEAEFEQLRQSTDSHAHLCSHIYSLFTSKTASKAITAQYLVEVLDDCLKRQVLSCEQIVDWLPGYLTEAIIYATTHLELAQEPAGEAS